MDTTTTTDQPQTGQASATATAATDMASQYVGKARDFAKARPAATAALAGVIGLAILNTLRGKG